MTVDSAGSRARVAWIFVVVVAVGWLVGSGVLALRSSPEPNGDDWELSDPVPAGTEVRHGVSGLKMVGAATNRSGTLVVVGGLANLQHVDFVFFDRSGKRKGWKKGARTISQIELTKVSAEQSSYDVRFIPQNELPRLSETGVASLIGYALSGRPRPVLMLADGQTGESSIVVFPGARRVRELTVAGDWLLAASTYDDGTYRLEVIRPGLPGKVVASYPVPDLINMIVPLIDGSARVRSGSVWYLWSPGELVAYAGPLSLVESPLLSASVFGAIPGFGGAWSGATVAWGPDAKFSQVSRVGETMFMGTGPAFADLECFVPGEATCDAARLVGWDVVGAVGSRPVAWKPNYSSSAFLFDPLASR